MSGEHHYRVTTTWIGDRGTGTSGYRDYDRTVRIGVDGKPDVIGSADPAFRGDATHHNPEDLLLIAISQCHLLSYLHACVTRGVVVTGYTDEASAVMAQEGNGGHFTSATLRPTVTVADESMVADAADAHRDAHEWCFIANSVNFPIGHHATVTVG
ncbi:OsmC family protein [Gordonia polyisoprenivorans]|uniref:OsmC family protein n=1 Tax=Gordonia polyisoprenivorans TaxID=84595 RepID=UPI000B99E576|nr:OsmC family protein [Gordonia polyisoprenivorans]OZC30377.1 peroxiredoxin [Gordonia polyisoprenivorans]